MWMGVKGILMVTAAFGVVFAPLQMHGSAASHSQTKAQQLASGTSTVSGTGFTAVHGSADTHGSAGVHSTSSIHGSAGTHGSQGNGASKGGNVSDASGGGSTTVVIRQPQQNPPSNSASVVLSGTVKSVNSGSLVIQFGNKDFTFNVSASTHVTFPARPIQRVDEMTNTSVTAIKAGDKVQVISKGGVALQIQDWGQFIGKYLPNGGSQVPVGATAQSSSAMQAGELK